MTLGLIILIFTCVTNMSLGLLVLLRNPKLRSNIYFICLTISVSLWAMANYLTEANLPIAWNQVFNRMAFLFGYLCLVSAALFSFNFPKKYTLKSHNEVLALLAGGILFGVFSATEWVSGMAYRTDGRMHFTSGPLSFVYIAVLLVLLAVAIGQLVRRMQSSSVQTRHQIRFIIIGILLSVVLTVFSNIIIPMFVSNFETAKFGPLLTVFFVASTAYAIAKYGLFDIRLIVARAVAYVFVVGTLALAYSVLVLTVTRVFLHRDVVLISNAQQVVSIGVTLFLVLGVGRLKKFFDRITNRYFYRDAYDAQDFLNDLNKVLASTIDAQQLLTRSADIIGNTIKSGFCLFDIHQTNGRPRRIVGIQPELLSDKAATYLQRTIPRLNQRVIITDNLPEEQSELQAMLAQYGIAVVGSLANSSGKRADGYGYLVLGRKKSGNSYSTNDVKTIEIVTDELTIAIQNALRFEEIENFNLTLQQKVDDATRKLRQTNEKLKTLDETKDEFISMASHQLRTPLTSVKGYVSMVLEGDAGEINDMQRKLLNQAFISSQRMVFLIADLLNVSRLRTGKFILEPKATNLATVVQDEVSQLLDTAASRNLDLQYDKPTAFPLLMLDETKVRQVIMNFIDNAIYYTGSGGHIRVELTDKPHSIELLVHDDGIGVPKAEQHHLFGKFYRANNAKKARPDGTGLGLFMAKKVIAAQGGSIVFTSQEGKGSVFGFSFPKARLVVGEGAMPSKMILPIK